jgi:hypothetical protein
MVVAKVRILRQEQNWFFFVNLIIFIIENFNQTNSDEVHLLDDALVLNDSSARRVDSAVEVDNDFVNETSLTFLKKVIE